MHARPVAAEAFAALMARLGPFERRPAVAVAVSGGGDSMALALLADAWARARGGVVRGLIVDHGLRDDSAAEAALTQQRLAARGIAARVLTVGGLAHGPGLAARARAARYAALEAACAADGILHLLLAHHAADQAETVAMRLLAGSGAAGLAAMAALAETRHTRLLRPLLTVPPGCLRATLVAAGVAWVDDPSNTNPTAQRARLRALRRDRDGIGPATRGAVASAVARGRARAWRERATAALLARRVLMAPEGFAVLSPGLLPPEAMAALVRCVGGAPWAPGEARTRALASGPRPATLGGARLLPAGRLKPRGWLLVREAAAVAGPARLARMTTWDGRFRLTAAATPPDGAEVGALGRDAARIRDVSSLPASVLQGLPAIRLRGKLVATPGLGYGAGWNGLSVRAVWAPTVAVAAAPFLAAPLWVAAAARDPDESVGMRD